MVPPAKSHLPFAFIPCTDCLLPQGDVLQIYLFVCIYNLTSSLWQALWSCTLTPPRGRQSSSGTLQGLSFQMPRCWVMQEVSDHSSSADLSLIWQPVASTVLHFNVFHWRIKWKKWGPTPYRAELPPVVSVLFCCSRTICLQSTHLLLMKKQIMASIVPLSTALLTEPSLICMFWSSVWRFLLVQTLRS